MDHGIIKKINKKIMEKITLLICKMSGFIRLLKRRKLQRE